MHQVSSWKDIKSFLTGLDWPRHWLDKYGEELTALVISVAEKAKQDGKIKPVGSTTLPIATDSQDATATNLQGATAIDLQGATTTDLQGATATNSQNIATDLQSVATENPNLFFPNSPDYKPMTLSTSRVLETIVTPQPRKKR